MSGWLHDHKQWLLSFVCLFPMNALKDTWLMSDFRCALRGWSIYTTYLGVSVPCYTVPTIALTLPATISATATTFATVILDKVFTLQYKLQPAAQAGLTTFAKLGIGIGVSVGIALL